MEQRKWEAQMARDDCGAAGSIIMAFVLGAFTGAAVALLMAPATGDEMRRKLAEKAREGRRRRPKRRGRGGSSSNRQQGTVRPGARARTRSL